ncbi:hypothetical protein MP228_003661 [Amoeboaphelidium protococcarum]|nr:hypothetical protein MP228_003661 [Amoeboaphelidium protococcarum]
MATRGEHAEVMHQLLDIFMRDQQVNRDHISVQIDRAVSVHSNNVQTHELSEQIEQFLINLSVCYQLYGCPTHIIEINMAKVARGLGMEVDFAIFPSYSLISVTKSEYGKLRKHTMYFTTSTGIDMYKLQMTDELVRRVQSYSSAEPPKSVTTDAAAQIVDQIANEVQALETADITDLAGRDVVETPKLDSASIKSLYRHPSVASGASIGGPMLRRKILDLAAYGQGFYYKQKAKQQQLMQPMLPGRSKDIPLQPLNLEDPNHKSGDSDNRSQYAKMFSQLAVEDAATTLNEIRAASPLYSRPVQLLFNSVSSAGCCGLFFGGNWTDVLVTTLLAAIIFGINLFGSRLSAYNRLNECFSGFLAALITRFVHYWITPLCFKAVAFSAFINSLKGVTITLSIVEIITKNYVSGTVRLFYGIVISASIGFGLDVATKLFASIIGVTKLEAMQMSECSADRGVYKAFYPLLFVMAATSFSLSMNSHRTQLLPMVACSALGYITGFLSDSVLKLGMSFSSMSSAFVLAVMSNLYARYSATPPILYVLSGLVMLVPGSLAVTSFFTYFSQTDDTGGIQMSLTFIELALALSIGIFMGSLVVPNEDTINWLKRFDKKRLGRFRSRDHNSPPEQLDPVFNPPNKIHKTSSLIF